MKYGHAFVKHAPAVRSLYVESINRSRSKCGVSDTDTLMMIIKITVPQTMATMNDLLGRSEDRFTGFYLSSPIERTISCQWMDFSRSGSLA